MHRGGGNARITSHNHGFNLIEAFNNLALWGEKKFVSELKRTYKFQRGVNCHTMDNSPKYHMVGEILSILRSFAYAQEDENLNRLRNKRAMTCFGNMNQNIFNDKDFSLKRAGATHVALCDSVGSYFRHWCAAFTLAEVLITLGIIGVVAAMTMPTLIANYQKQVATTRLKKFYTTYSQAYNQSKNDNYDIDGADILKNGLNSTQMMDWYDTYLRPYFKTVRADKTKYGVEVAFPDGSGMLIEKDGCAAGTVCTHVVYCVQYKYCEEIKDKGHIYLLPDAKHTFLFYTSGVPSEVYEYKEDGSMVGLTNYDRETALTSCKKGKRNCTRLLYMDNWEIKKDYPWWN